MRQVTVVLVVVGGLISVTGCAAPLPEPIRVVDASEVGYRIEREPLARWDELRFPNPDWKVWASPEGPHLAVVARRGDKQVLIVDGRPGPGFDDISGIAVTDDGRHYAYRARSGHRWRVVLDDEPQMEFDEVGGVYVDAGPDSPYPYDVWLLGFIEAGDRLDHLVYAGRNGREWHVVVDGTPGPGFDGRLVAVPELSEDAKHVSYVVEQQVSKHPEQFRRFLFVDGKAIAECDDFIGGVPAFGGGGRLTCFPAEVGGAVERMKLVPIAK